MNKIAWVSVVATAVLLVTASLSSAGPRRGPEVDVFIGVGPVYRYPPPPYYVYPPVIYPPVIYPAPVVVPAPVYVVPAPVYVSPPPPPAQAYWYYCQSLRGYYPAVANCPEAWIAVPTR